jgi:pimeloyl-ACP methyl ester carboxylesterase
MTRRYFLAIGLVLCFLPRIHGDEPKTFNSNGVKLHYVTEGKGEPVVLVHGFAVNHQLQWVRPGIFKDLARDYQVITLDNRGHGQSDKPHDPKKYGKEMVEDIIRLLDHLEIKRAHIVGYSMGAFITLKLVTVHPERVLSATLGGAGRHVQGDERWLEELADSLENGKGFSPLLLRLHPASRPKPSETDLRIRSAVIGALNDSKACAALVRSYPELLVVDDHLKANKVPVLALIGSIDPLKAGVDALKGQMTNLTIEVIEGGDHMNAFLFPDFNRKLREFLGKHGQPK